MKSAKGYDDAFESIMDYAQTRVGIRKIKSENDLRTLFRDLDTRRKDQAGGKRISDHFIDILLTRQEKVDKYVGKVVGSGQRPRVASAQYVERVRPKIEMLREQGIHAYPYDGGYARKDRIFGRDIARDVDTGRFVSLKKLRDDDDE